MKSFLLNYNLSKEKILFMISNFIYLYANYLIKNPNTIIYREYRPDILPITFNIFG